MWSGVEVRGDSETLRRDCVCWMTWNAALAFHDWIDGGILFQLKVLFISTRLGDLVPQVLFE